MITRTGRSIAMAVLIVGGAVHSAGASASEGRWPGQHDPEQMRKVLTTASSRQDGSAAQGAPAESRMARPGRRGRGVGRAPVPPEPGMMTVQQVEQYFDQVVLFQAQSQLQLTDGQFLRFGAGLRRLQAARRQYQRQRLMLIRQLNRMLNSQPLDEAAVAARVRELDELTEKGKAEVRDAYAAIDQSLDVRQRARFRIFEEAMERRKLDLLSRARQAAASASDDTTP